MSTDFRALCAELLQPLAEYDGANPYHEHRALITRARAALAEPVGDGPTEALVDDLFNRFADSYQYGLWSMDKDGFRAALARWGTPATPPAPELGEVGDQERLRIMEAGIRSGYMAGHNDTVEACYGDPDEFAADNAPEILGEVSATFEAMLAQPPAPAPVMVVPVGVAECPHCGYAGEMARAPQAGEGEG